MPPDDYAPPTRLATLLRSGGVFWSAFAVTLVVIGGGIVLAYAR